MLEDNGNWYSVSGTFWKCPECHQWSWYGDWVECEPYCEDCGSHDGRQCPNCGEEWDHVWGAGEIADAMEFRQGFTSAHLT